MEIEQRGRSFRARVRVPGSDKRVSRTFDTKAEARAWGRRTEAELAARARAGIRTDGMLVEQLFDRYMSAVGSKTDSAVRNRKTFDSLAGDPLSVRTVASVTTDDINDWISRRSAATVRRTGRAVKPATVQRELNSISAAFAYAVSGLRILAVNPCHGAHLPEAARPKKRALLTPKEIEAILTATGYLADPGLRTKTARVGAAFLLALETGMRSGEILRLRPEDYWRDRKTVLVSASERGGRKGSRSGRARVDSSRRVPLTGRAIELLDALLASMPADQEPIDGMSMPPYIVGMTDAQRDALWRKARDQSGVADVTFHHTKHEACTRLARHIDVLALSHAIGTKDIRLLRDTYYESDAETAAASLPAQLAPSIPARD